MKHGSFFAICIAAMTLTGCGDEGKFKKIMACRIAANELQQSDAQRKIDKHTAKFLRDSGYRPTSGDIIRLSEEVRYDDMDLAGRSAGQQLEIFLDTFNSGFCQDIHGQDDLNMSDF